MANEKPKPTEAPRAAAAAPAEPAPVKSPSAASDNSRVLALAERIYLHRVLSHSSSTLEFHAEMAFREAEAFWAFADARTPDLEE